MKTIFIEDFARPKYRDTTVPFVWPLRKLTASGFADSRSILPAYRSLRVKIPYDAQHLKTFLIFKMHSDIALPSGAIRVYGWRDPNTYVQRMSTLQYQRVENFDWIDLEPIRLGGVGSESVFALSVEHQWRWFQLACFWPTLSCSILLSEESRTNIIKPDDACYQAPPADPFVSDDFQDKAQ